MKTKPVILIVDDNFQNSELLEAYLVPEGYEIVKVTSGEEGLVKLSANHIDLILLDVILSGLDGFEVTRRIRENDKISLLPIILITVLSETEDRVKGIEAGCDDFISKPVDKTELLARVRSLLKVKAYNDLMSNYRKELEYDVSKKTYELKHALENLKQDITERKQSKEKEKNLEAQLQHSQKLESIGTLASGIAHDFNNILNIISGHSFLLQLRTNDPQKLAKSIEAITKATQRGALLVNQLLTFARKTETLFETVIINEMVSEIKKFLGETFPKTIVISTSLQQDLPTIIADGTQIHQVLLNLCVNARDAMPNGGMIFISTSIIKGKSINIQFPKTTARQYVKIEVTDTGAGMDEATRLRIFEPFFTTKGLGKGTGLGLAVVFGIVENHRGFIEVMSIPGKGTNFFVYFPIPEFAPEEVQPAEKSLEELPCGSETILLIEDEEMLCELVKASLVSKGYTVLTAEDGLLGVEMYQNHQKEIAVVLSDLGLPKLEGKDVFGKILEINPKAKVIMTSGFIEPEMKSKMFKAGLKDFIQKPYLQNEILQKIRVAIDTNE